MSVIPNPLSRPDASIGLACGLGHHSLRRPAHYPPLRQLPIPLPGLSTPLAARSFPLSTTPARPLRVSVKALKALSPGGVGKVEFYTGDLSRRIWLESDFWGRSQDYFSTFPTVATGGRRAIAQSPPERPAGSRRATFRESAVPTISSCEFVTI